MPNGERAPKDWYACPKCQDPLEQHTYCPLCGKWAEIIEIKRGCE